ncbi:MAG: YggS family pyridoxal phosphate-dependent enzyme [Coriobacteriia bacterium]|nr:YggS family pyridoxal phosphate-dependent enzyme [Coriobacteriia bacterium]
MISFPIFSGEDTEIIAELKKNLHEIQLDINSAAASVGRDPADVLMVAVSKAVDVPQVQAALEAGIHDFGENRTKALRERQQAFPRQNWHYIGHIQTNKLKDVVGRACLIHSVANERALETIGRLAKEQDACQSVLLEVNVSGEESKDGVRADELPQLLERASTISHIAVKGLMTMAPRLLTSEDTVARHTFVALRELRDKMVSVFDGAENISLNELSMGMSNDFVYAIQEGATIVRIGRRLWS